MPQRWIGRSRWRLAPWGIPAIVRRCYAVGCRHDLRRGKALHQAPDALFPAHCRWLIRSGELTGTLDEILAQCHGEQARQKAEQLAQLAEPALLLTGAMVCGLAVILYVPLLQLGGKFLANFKRGTAAAAALGGELRDAGQARFCRISPRELGGANMAEVNGSWGANATSRCARAATAAFADAGLAAPGRTPMRQRPARVTAG
ncbi:type II secretion system F family protein [Candidatus Sodalis pierantonius]|uniref:type II secretion system F family protein n=1 Tax=Candidatus Sodalis pierantonii TaxID=1486991 RepID=UPI00046D297C|nr:type II secretion system F family protein [Candidatus Sodalis pierantonius]